MILARLLCLSTPLPAPAPDGDAWRPPEWLHLVPYGEWRGHPTRVFAVGAAEADQVLANHARRGRTRLVLDYEHQTLRSIDNGKPAPAAGWIDLLEKRADGVWGHVEEWTAAAEGYLRAREYRYLSPVLSFDRRDKRTGEPAGLHLHSVALTNVPFLDELTPVVNSDTTLEIPMLELRKLLGLADDATDEQVVAAVQAHLASLRTGLALADDADITAITTALQAAQLPLQLGRLALSELDLGDAPQLEPAKARLRRELKHSGYVPLTEHVEALRAHETQVTALTDDQVIEQARAAGKLTPGLEPWFKRQLGRDREGAMAWLNETPAIVPLKSPIPAAGATSPVQLSDAEQAVCTQLGISPEQFLATRPKEG